MAKGLNVRTPGRLATALLAAALLLTAGGPAAAQAKRWDIPAPKAPPGEIALKAPAPAPPAIAETWSMSGSDNVPVVQNVSTPTLTPFLPPPDKATCLCRFCVAIVSNHKQRPNKSAAKS